MRLSWAIGAASGGLGLYFDTRIAYQSVVALDAFMFLLSILVLRTLPKVPPSPVVKGEPRLEVLRDKPYAVITGLSAQRTDAPRWMVSAVLILNTMSVMLFQVRVARQVNGLTSAAKLVRHTGIIMLAACAVFAFSAIRSGAWVAAAILVVAVVLQVVAEMAMASGTWEIGFGLASSVPVQPSPEWRAPYYSPLWLSAGEPPTG